MRRRKTVYPPAKTATKSGPTTGPARPGGPMTGAVTINLRAMTGRTDIRQGARVRIAGGMYEGELAVVESVVGGVIPAAVVRMASGQARRVRAVDLLPWDGSGAAAGDAPPAERS